VLFEKDDQRHCHRRTVQVFHVTLHFSALLTRTGEMFLVMRSLGPLGLVLLLLGVGLWVYSIKLAFYADYDSASFQSDGCPRTLVARLRFGWKRGLSAAYSC